MTLNLYELVDASDEEIYQTLGIFRSIEAVLAVIKARDGVDGGRVNTESGNDEDEILEIRLRVLDAFDPCNTGTVVRRIHRFWKWSDDEEHVVWVSDFGALHG